MWHRLYAETAIMLLALAVRALTNVDNQLTKLDRIETTNPLPERQRCLDENPIDLITGYCAGFHPGRGPLQVTQKYHILVQRLPKPEAIQDGIETGASSAKLLIS
jgi:hypothetical protein